MQKAGKIEKLSLGDIRNTTKDNCAKLIDAISSVVDRNLGISCSVVSISHSYEYKVLISNKTSSVQTETREKPGNTLRKTDEPTELHLFTYEKLKESAKFNHGKYRGKLYGSIKLCECDKIYPVLIVLEQESALHAMEKNRLNALSAMEIKNVYHVMELELTHAQIVRATEIVQNVMMDGTPAMSDM